MQVLVHLGLNKCASTYIQQALAAAQARLRGAGVFYAVEGARPAQYGLSRHYGFGPDVGGVTPRSLSWLVREAERRECAQMVISSEYLSLHRPEATAAFVTDMDNLGVEARYLFFSREIGAWVRSLFNQYVKTVDAGPHFHSINGFVDHVLANGAIDIARRYRGWEQLVGAERLTHHPIDSEQPPASVLDPFSEFCRIEIAPPDRPAGTGSGNHSMSPGALYLTGLIRQALPTPGRDLLIGCIAERRCDWVPVPTGYLEIDTEHAQRLQDRIALPYADLCGVQSPVIPRTSTAA